MDFEYSREEPFELIGVISSLLTKEKLNSLLDFFLKLHQKDANIYTISAIHFRYREESRFLDEEYSQQNLVEVTVIYSKTDGSVGNYYFDIKIEELFNLFLGFTITLEEKKYEYKREEDDPLIQRALSLFSLGKYESAYEMFSLYKDLNKGIPFNCQRKYLKSILGKHNLNFKDNSYKSTFNFLINKYYLQWRGLNLSIKQAGLNFRNKSEFHLPNIFELTVHNSNKSYLWDIYGNPKALTKEEELYRIIWDVSFAVNDDFFLDLPINDIFLTALQINLAKLDILEDWESTILDMEYGQSDY